MAFPPTDSRRLQKRRCCFCQRRAQVEAMVTDFPSWFLDPGVHNNYANSISNNPYVRKLTFTDNFEVIFQDHSCLILNRLWPSTKPRPTDSLPPFVDCD